MAFDRSGPCVLRGAAVAHSIPEVLGKIAARGGAPQSNPGGHRARCARLSPINSGQIPSLDPGGKWSANTKEVRSAAPRSTDGLLSSLASLSNRWGIQLAGGEIRIQTRASESPKSSDLDCSDLERLDKYKGVKVPIHTIQGVLATIGIAYILGS